jgi:type I restriction enzyme S subunit
MNGDLPQGWASAQVSELFSSHGGGTPNRGIAAYWNGNIPWLSSGDIKSTSISESSETITKRGLEESAARLCRRGSVLVVVRSGILKHTLPVAVLEREAAINQDIKAFDSGDDQLNSWLALAWRTSARNLLAENREGTTVQSVKLETLRDSILAIPPLAEQRRIVAKLELLLGQVEACQRRLDKIPTLLKRFRQAVLAAACSGRLTEDWREEKPAPEVNSTDNSTEGFVDLPETWQWQKIGNLFTVETGTTPPKKQPANYSPTPSACPFFKPTDLDASTRVREAREWLSAQGEEHARLLPAMTVCVTSIGATIGKTGLLRVRGATNQQVNSILPTEGVQPEFTFFYCCSPYFQRRIVEESSSTTLPIINKGRFEELEFPLLPLAEQQEIVRRVERLFALADNIEQRYKKAQTFVDKLTPSLLSKAFRGELVPQDPNDEPASVLLGRIGAGKPDKPKKRENR